MKYHGQKQITKQMGGKLQNKIEKLHSWICNHPHVVNLTLTNNHINIRYNKTCEVIKT